eukprot:PLAT3614.12.p1 GENE.PLAT3614.12~~PLAT3614.12.p1  ORF type:complete len:1190 (+),score=627.46 PLAT3614.12:3029-6598(+)
MCPAHLRLIWGAVDMQKWPTAPVSCTHHGNRSAPHEQSMSVAVALAAAPPYVRHNYCRLLALHRQRAPERGQPAGLQKSAVSSSGKPAGRSAAQQRRRRRPPTAPALRRRGSPLRKRGEDAVRAAFASPHAAAAAALAEKPLPLPPSLESLTAAGGLAIFRPRSAAASPSRSKKAAAPASGSELSGRRPWGAGPGAKRRAVRNATGGSAGSRGDERRGGASAAGSDGRAAEGGSEAAASGGASDEAADDGERAKKKAILRAQRRRLRRPSLLGSQLLPSRTVGAALRLRKRHGGIRTMQRDAAALERKTTRLRQQVCDVDASLADMRSQIEAAKRAIGSRQPHVAAEKAERALAAKERQAEQALSRVMKRVVSNQRLRDAVDRLRSDRMHLATVLTALRDDIVRAVEEKAACGKRRAAIALQADGVSAQAAEVDRVHSKRRRAYEAQIRSEDEEVRLMDSAAGAKVVAGRSEHEKRLRHIESKSTWSFILGEQASISKVHTYKEAFRRVKEVTGILDLDEFVAFFKDGEAQNFALFNAVSALEADAMALRKQLVEVEVSIERVTKTNLDNDITRKRILSDTETAVADKTAAAERLRQWNAEATAEMAAACAGTAAALAVVGGVPPAYRSSLFHSALSPTARGGKSSSSGGRGGGGGGGSSSSSSSRSLAAVGKGSRTGVNIRNLLQCLGLLDQRCVEVLHSYAAARRLGDPSGSSSSSSGGGGGGGGGGSGAASSTDPLIAWLNSVRPSYGLEYADAFRAEGYETVEDLQLAPVTEEILREMGITKRVPLMRLKVACAKLAGGDGSGEESKADMLEGRYRIVQPLVTDGSRNGLVLAEDVKSRKTVVVKYVEEHSEWVREKDALQALESDFVVPLLDFYENVTVPDGRTVHLLVFPRGECTLATWLADNRDNVAHKFVLRRFAQCLAHMHGKGFVHGDIKPANIMLFKVSSAVTRWKLIDFGTAVRTGTPLTTQASPEFMAPEMGRADAEDGMLKLAADPAIDVWGFGMSVLNVLQGRSLFGGRLRGDGKLQDDAMAELMSEEPLRLGRLGSGSAQKLLYQYCLVKEPAKRSSMQMMLQRAFLKGTTTIGGATVGEEESTSDALKALLAPLSASLAELHAKVGAEDGKLAELTAAVTSVREGVTSELGDGFGALQAQLKEQARAAAERDDASSEALAEVAELLEAALDG